MVAAQRLIRDGVLERNQQAEDADYNVLRVSQPVALATGCRNLEADHIRVGARFQTGETPIQLQASCPN
jgi:hypothetical protein